MGYPSRLACAKYLGSQEANFFIIIIIAMKTKLTRYYRPDVSWSGRHRHAVALTHAAAL